MSSRTMVATSLQQFVAVLTAGLVIASMLVTVVQPAPVVAQVNNNQQQISADWVHWATDNQRNELAIDEPINWVTRVRALNAMSSVAYGQSTDPNQYHSITRMLDDGVRIVSLDIHVLGGEIYFCHNNFCVLPFFEREPYENIIAEIGDWLARNSDEFIWLQFEFNPNSHQEGGMSAEVFASNYLPEFEETLREHFGSDAIYKSNEISLPTAAHDRWPSLRELRAQGKQVLMSATNIETSEWIWHDGRSGGVLTGAPGAEGAGQGTALEVDLDACTGLEETEVEVKEVDLWTADSDAWSEVTEARTSIQTLFETAGVLNHQAVEQATKCNVAIIGLDFVSAMQRTPTDACLAWEPVFGDVCSERDERIARTVWSWSPNYYPVEDFAFLDPRAGWVSAENNAGNRFHFACTVPRDGHPSSWADQIGERWEVTRVTGEWESGDQICAEEFDGVEFSVPVNGWQNEQLKAALAEAQSDPAFDDSNDHVWLKYRRSESTNRWVQTSMPRILSLSTQEVDGVIEFETTVDNPEMLDLFMIWDFSIVRDVTSNDGVDAPTEFSGVSQHSANGSDVYRFSMPFPVGPHSVHTTLYFKAEWCGNCYKPIDTQDASFQYGNLNELPVLDSIGTRLRSDLHVVDDINGDARRLQQYVRFDDPDDTRWQVTIDYGDGTVEQIPGVDRYPGGGQFLLLHDYLERGEFQVTFTVTEIRDGQPQGSSNGTFLVINHSPGVDPVWEPSADCDRTVLEPGVFTVCLIDFTDSNVDTDTFEATVDRGDDSAPLTFSGSDFVDYELEPDLHRVQFNLRYATPGTYDLIMRVTDDGSKPNAEKVYIEKVITIHVVAPNTPPTIADLDPDVTITPGTTFTRTFTIVDPDVDDTFTGLVRYGPSTDSFPIQINPDRTFTLSQTYTTEGIFEIVFIVEGHFERPEGPAKNSTGPTRILVTVANPNSVPVLDAGGDATIAAGQPFTRTATFTDPDADEWIATVNYGDDPTFDAPIVDPVAKSFDLSHHWTVPGTYDVVVVLYDGRNASAVMFTVTVTDAIPVVEAGPNATVDENSTFSETGSFSDASPDDTHTGTVDYGDGSGEQPLALAGDKTFSLEHTYVDNGAYTVTVCVTDVGGGEGCDTLTVDVANVAPSVTVSGGGPLHQGETFTGSGTFSDPGADSWSATVDWGDGTPTEALDLNPDGGFALTHTYVTSGSMIVTVCVTDDDGGEGCASLAALTAEPYAIFVGRDDCGSGSNDALRISGSSWTLNGDVHSNSGLRVSGSQHDVDGGGSYRCDARVSGSRITFTSGPSLVDETRPLPVQMSVEDFDCTFSVEGTFDLSKSGEWWVDGNRNSRQLLPGVYCATGTNGLIKLSGSSISGQVTLVAAEITISGSRLELTAYQDNILAFASGTGLKALKLSGSSADLTGMLVAPVGGVTISSSSLELAGGIVGWEAKLSGSGWLIDPTGSLSEP